MDIITEKCLQMNSISLCLFDFTEARKMWWEWHTALERRTMWWSSCPTWSIKLLWYAHCHFPRHIWQMLFTDDHTDNIYYYPQNTNNSVPFLVYCFYGHRKGITSNLCRFIRTSLDHWALKRLGCTSIICWRLWNTSTSLASFTEISNQTISSTIETAECE